MIYNRFCCKHRQHSGLNDELGVRPFIATFAAAALAAGQPEFQVQSFPFQLTDANMTKYRNDPNFSFRENLKQG